MAGDGGAMYTLQALWTQARENCDVGTLSSATEIHDPEMMRALKVGPRALDMFDSPPCPD